MKVGGIDRIMLDNFNIENTKEAVRRINGRFEVESSRMVSRSTHYVLRGMWRRLHLRRGFDSLREELGHELQGLLNEKRSFYEKK